MIQLKTNDEQLNLFLELCKKDKDFKRIETFKNSVLVHFKKTIYSDVYEHLKKLDNRVMIYSNIDLINNEIELILFIYKYISYAID